MNYGININEISGENLKIRNLSPKRLAHQSNVVNITKQTISKLISETKELKSEETNEQKRIKELKTQTNQWKSYKNEFNKVI